MYILRNQTPPIHASEPDSPDSLCSNRIAVWSAHGSCAPDKYHTTHDAITSTAFSNDDSVVVMGTQDGMIVIYDVVHNETIDVIPAHQNCPCR